MLRRLSLQELFNVKHILLFLNENNQIHLNISAANETMCKSFCQLSKMKIIHNPFKLIHTVHMSCWRSQEFMVCEWLWFN